MLDIARNPDDIDLRQLLCAEGSWFSEGRVPQDEALLRAARLRQAECHHLLRSSNGDLFCTERVSSWRHESEQPGRSDDVRS
jgi:hypothetical protein